MKLRVKIKRGRTGGLSEWADAAPDQFFGLDRELDAFHVKHGLRPFWFRKYRWYDPRRWWYELTRGIRLRREQRRLNDAK